MENRILQFGKYKGKFIPSVIEDDPQYIQWAYTNLERFSLTEQEKYLLFIRLSREGLIDKQLLSDISAIPRVDFDGIIDIDKLTDILSPIESQQLLQLRPQIKSEYNTLVSYCKNNIENSYREGRYDNFLYYVDEVNKTIARLRKKCNNILKRPHQQEDIMSAANSFISVIDDIIPAVDSFFKPYIDKIKVVSTKIEQREEVLKLQNAARIQEKLKSERIAAIDKHPYKDIDETFLVKLDDILGVNEYKINQCVYKIDYESDTISSYQIKELKSVFGESKLEIKDRNDKISIYVTQNIEPVPSNRNADNYISALNGFLLQLQPEERNYIFSLGKDKSKEVFDRVENYFENTGKFPTYGMLFNEYAAREQEISADDVIRWLQGTTQQERDIIKNELNKGEQKDNFSISSKDDDKISPEDTGSDVPYPLDYPPF